MSKGAKGLFHSGDKCAYSIASRFDFKHLLLFRNIRIHRGLRRSRLVYISGTSPTGPPLIVIRVMSKSQQTRQSLGRITNHNFLFLHLLFGRHNDGRKRRENLIAARALFMLRRRSSVSLGNPSDPGQGGVCFFPARLQAVRSNVLNQIGKAHID
jgi:hypothetical protein